MDFAVDADDVTRRRETRLAIARAHIAACDPHVRAFTFVASLASFRQAECGAARPAGAPLPLDGVTVAVKASLPVAGMSTTAGSRAFASQITARDGVVAARLRRAGALVVGQTNMDEFGIGVRTCNGAHGATRNPWSAAHTPGGSSGGSAAAVASGQCSAAIGVDTAGSIRIPAALCGVTGFMPCADVAPDPREAFCATRFDRIGTIARSAAACARLFDAISDGTGAPLAAGLGGSIAGVKLGVAVRYVAGATSGVVRNLVRAMAALRRLGLSIGRCALPRTDVRPMLDVLAWERHRALRPLFERDRDALEPPTQRYLEAAQQISDARYADALQACTQASLALVRGMEPFDLVLLPTTPAPAPKLGAPDRFLLANTYAFNLSGQPAIALPSGFAGALPTSVMLVGRRGESALLLRVAHALQQVTHHHEAAPLMNDGESE